MVAAACGSDRSELSPRAEAVGKIKVLEEKMHKSMELDRALADSALVVYEKFVIEFPQDSISADLLFKAAEIATAIGEYEKALHYYKQIIAQYPHFKLFPESMFLEGSLLDNYMDHDGDAKMIYEEIIEKYPGSAYAHDAKSAISNLGLSDEELMKQFKEKEKK